jgi:hypothetical protein
MRIIAAALLAASFVLPDSVAVAQQLSADDIKWINQCIRDNRRQGAAPDVVRKSCICMNEKMDDNETRSITEWEKANPKAMADRDRQAGWK